MIFSVKDAVPHTTHHVRHVGYLRRLFKVTLYNRHWKSTRVTSLHFQFSPLCSCKFSKLSPRESMDWIYMESLRYSFDDVTV